MRKWTYLVAALLLVGTTATFTGCIDNDEPAGIENLRGAKAELLRAKCAVEAAEAARLNAVAEYQKALAAHEQANADFRKAEAEWQKLQNEWQSAQNDEEKARIEAQIAFYKQSMEQAALTHQAAMLRLQQGLAEANRNYELALKQIEIAEALMSDSQKITIETLKGRVASAKGTVDTKADAVYQAEKNLYDAMLDKAQGGQTQAEWIPELELKLKRAEGALIADEVALTKLKEFTEKDVTTTDWRKEVKTLEESIEALKLKETEYDVELAKLTNSDEYRAAKQAKDDALNALNGIKTSEYTYTYKFKATDYPYGRAEFVVTDKTPIKPDQSGGAEKEVKDELEAVKGDLAKYTTEKVAMLEELAKNETKTIETAKTAYTNSAAAWKTALDKYAKVGDYDQTKAKKTVEDAGKAYDIAFAAAASDPTKENVARKAYAKALTTYYADAEKYVGCVTNEIELDLTLNNIPVGKEKRTISAWLSDANLSGVALGAILTVNPTWVTADLYTENKAIKTLGDAASLLADLKIKSLTAFGTGCVSNHNEEYMRVEPTEVEVLAAIKANGNRNNCGLTGDYYQKKQAVASQEHTNYKEVMADFQAAITSLTAKLSAMTKEVADAKADSKAKEDAFKVFEDKELALGVDKGIVTAKWEALDKVRLVLVQAINTHLGLGNVTFVDTEAFEKALQVAVEEAEDKVIASQKTVAKAKVNLQKAKEGKYDAVATAQKDLDEATAELGEAQTAYETALADLKTGLEIMAGTAK